MKFPYNHNWFEPLKVGFIVIFKTYHFRTILNVCLVGNSCASSN